MNPKVLAGPRAGEHEIDAVEIDPAVADGVLPVEATLSEAGLKELEVAALRRRLARRWRSAW
jgi:hypothetical protein